MSGAPEIRLRSLNSQTVDPAGEWVLYWMTMQRRPGFNFALEHAASEAARLGRPLVILEALRLGYPRASERSHAFILQGMAANARALAGRPVFYFPFVETIPDQGKGLLAALAARACLVVADDHPGFFLPRMLAAAGRQIPVQSLAVDGCGLLPLAAAGQAYPSAHAFRRFLQKELPGHLAACPVPDPLAGLVLPRLAGLPAEITRRWPTAPAPALAAAPGFLAALAIDHSVPPAPLVGGWQAARQRLAAFLNHGLSRYLERHHPDAEAGSGLSPWLHFGHISPHEVFAALAARENWGPQRLGAKPAGQREGWWGMSPPAEAFLDQLVTWRELGLNAARHLPDYDQYESLPAWARQGLAAAAGDPRPFRYRLEQFRAAATHDQLWNAAQRQLNQTGVMHNYLRMLWGKKILEWTASPQEALAVMLELNDRLALDGRDPNSICGVFWVLGRYDRPFGRRPVSGPLRPMTSASARRKLRLRQYLARWGG